MKYTKAQLVKGMYLYLNDVLVNEDDYEENSTGDMGSAKMTIERLLEFVDEDDKMIWK